MSQKFGLGAVTVRYNTAPPQLRRHADEELSQPLCITKLKECLREFCPRLCKASGT
jgi:hypothetical protein